MVSCSRDLELCRKFIHSQSAIVTECIFYFFPQFRQSSAPPIIMHRRKTIFKLVTPLEHTRMIHSFITMCSFYLIINLNWSFSLPNEIMDDACISQLVGDWIDIFTKTYCRIGEPVSLQRGGIRLQGSVANV